MRPVIDAMRVPGCDVGCRIDTSSDRYIRESRELAPGRETRKDEADLGLA